MTLPQDLRYTASHEYVRAEGDRATVGITAHAAEELGDVVYVELPEVGKTLARGEKFGVVESVKAVSDLYTPVGGRVAAVNGQLTDDPGQVNREPYGGGWMIQLEAVPASDLEATLTADQYAASIS